MSLCRECEVVLWRGHETCPRCCARRPAVRVRVAPRPSPARSVLGVLCLATTAPAGLAADALLRRLVG